MKKFLIIGGAGFIGLHLTKKLLKKNIVHIADNFSRGKFDIELSLLQKHKNFQLIKIDFLNNKKVKNDLDKDYDYIINLAAILGVKNVINNPFQVLSNNYQINSNFIELCIQQSNLKKALFSSTSEVYADSIMLNRTSIPTKELSPISIINPASPRSSYFLSKVYGESMMHYSDIPFTIFRPHNIYGPRMGMAHVIPELFQKMHYNKDGEVVVFSPSHTRAFCYVDDAIKQIELLITSKKGLNKTFNIGNPIEEIKIKELSFIIREVVGSNCKLIFKNSNDNSQKRRCPDLTEIIKLKNRKINFVNLYNGLEKTYHWYKKSYFN